MAHLASCPVSSNIGTGDDEIDSLECFPLISHFTLILTENATQLSTTNGQQMAIGVGITKSMTVLGPVVLFYSKVTTCLTRRIPNVNGLPVVHSTCVWYELYTDVFIGSFVT